MLKTKNTKNALISAILVLCMTFTALLGTTFAWFTDEVTSSGNKIQTGTLKVDLELLNEATNTWKSLKGENDPIFNYAEWEPGYTDVKLLKVENEGSLALKWKTVLTKYGEISALADVIDVYVCNYGVLTDAEAATLAYPADRSLAGYTRVGTAAEFLSTMEETTKGVLKAGQSAYLGLALKMRADAGNEYQGMSLGGTFDITVVATQASAEDDSFGNTYDSYADWPFYSINFTATEPIADKSANGVLVEEVSVGKAEGQVSAVVPNGVKLADGAESLDLSVKSMKAPTNDFNLEAGETAKSIDVHIEGVAEDNTVPMLVTLRQLFSAGLNNTSVKLYHIEDGTPVEMMQVTLAELDAHNEYNYDPATGDVVMSVASFSEYTVIEDSLNRWEGGIDTSWYNETGTEFTISNADQLAGFAAIVDGKVEGIEQDSFYGKTVNLNNNIYLSGELFDPIGWGYVNTGWNRDGADGKVFRGTFDGGEYTIFDLYQDGWDLETSTGTDYTYTNCGFGLFAAASDATFKNLTISGADIRVECVEAGVLVGLSQNDCTYENIKIYNSKIANYQRPAGGLIGEVSGEGTTTITDVTIGSDVVVGSLWGDFDAPVGGVIGAYWDDVGANPQIEMTTVEVGCRLDVYNDVTSTYQWYAYRRAGMLIGNTDCVGDDGHTASASFLTCDDVTVYYGNWTNYHYCEFSNHNSSWPFVRVEAGENCSAFSNPRWGVPNDISGVKVTPARHSKQDYSIHKDGDDCYVLLEFNQLYGGGQGVYGQQIHTGVTSEELAYTITYVNDDEILDIIYVSSNASAYPTQNQNAQDIVVDWVGDHIEGNVVFGGWMNAGSTKLTEIPAGNEDNIVLYPYFNSPHTASFVDQNDNILAWCFFNEEDIDELATTKSLAESKLPYLGAEYVFDYWEVRGTKENGTAIKEEYNVDSFKSYGTDVTVYPYYIYDGTIQMIPVDEDNDGDTDYYRVDASEITREGEDVVIPDYVNGIPVKVINSGAFDDGRLRDVYVPNTIEKIGKNAFCEDNRTEYPQIQIIFDGTKAEWDALTKESGWDDNIGTGSVIICTQEPNKGYYLQNGSNGFLGIGTKIKWEWQAGSFPDWYPRQES